MSYTSAASSGAHMQKPEYQTYSNLSHHHAHLQFDPTSSYPMSYAPPPISMQSPQAQHAQHHPNNHLHHHHHHQFLAVGGSGNGGGGGGGDTTAGAVKTLEGEPSGGVETGGPSGTYEDLYDSTANLKKQDLKTEIHHHHHNNNHQHYLDEKQQQTNKKAMASSNMSKSGGGHQSASSNQSIFAFFTFNFIKKSQIRERYTFIHFARSN